MRIKRLPLPRFSGPKLEPFRGTATADIEFIAFIGHDEDMDSKVWKVRIDDKLYALKVVSTFPPFTCLGDPVTNSDCNQSFAVFLSELEVPQSY